MVLLELIRRFDILHIKRRLILQKVASETGLYLGQLPIIEYIINNDGCSQVDIADTLYLSPASVAISTKRLQKTGIIKKTIDEENLRSKKLTITDKGRKVAEACRKSFNSVDEKMFSGFNESELAQLRDYLDRLISNISCGQDKGSNISYYEMISLRNQLHNQLENCGKSDK